MAALRKGISPAILLFAACTLWGVATVLNKSLLVTFAPVPLLLIELLASAFALWVACLALARPLPRGKTLLVAVALGVLNPGIAYTFSLLGLSRISASVTSLLWATEPFLITFLAAVVLREKVTRPVIAVIGLGFAGVVLVSGLLSASGLGQTDMVGTIYLFLAVLICAFYTVLSRWLGGSVDALALVTVQQTAGLGWAALLALIMPTSGPAPPIPLSLYAAAILAGLMYYAAAYWLYLSALSRVSAALAGGSFNIIPLVTIAVAVVFLGESLTLAQSLGAALILVSALSLFRLTRAPSG